MKTVISLLTLFLISLAGCSTQPAENADITCSQIMTDVKWGSDIKTIKLLFENEYKLEFEEELEQIQPGAIGYEFRGGKIEGVNTHSWLACFENDSLVFILVKVESDSSEETEKQFKSFINGVDIVSFVKVSDRENEWAFSENEAVKGTLQLNKQEGAIVLLFASEKYYKQRLKQ